MVGAYYRRMTIIGLLLWILALGFVCFAVYKWAPVPNGFKMAVYFVCMAIVVLLILHAFGIMPDLNTRVPTVR